MPRMTLVLRYITYAAMAVVVGLGLAGRLERDASSSVRSTDGTARASWPSVTRQGLVPTIVVHVENRGPVPRVPAIRLTAKYLRDLQLDSVTPEPESAEAVADGMVELRFPALPAGVRLEAELSFDITQQAATLRARSPLVVTLGGRTLLSERMSTLILP